jgi:hypothetical protein
MQVPEPGVPTGHADPEDPFDNRPTAPSKSATVQKERPKSVQQKFDEWLTAAAFDKNFTFEEIMTAISNSSVDSVTNLLARAVRDKKLKKEPNGGTDHISARNWIYRRLRPEKAIGGDTAVLAGIAGSPDGLEKGNSLGM